MFLLGSLTFAVLAWLLQTDPALAQWDLRVARTFRDIQSGAPWQWMEQVLFGVFVGREVAVLAAPSVFADLASASVGGIAAAVDLLAGGPATAQAAALPVPPLAKPQVIAAPISAFTVAGGPNARDVALQSLVGGGPADAVNWLTEVLGKQRSANKRQSLIDSVDQVLARYAQ